MSYSPAPAPRQTVAPSRKAFTLLELMVAIVLLVVAMSIAFQAFGGVVQAWKRGTEVANGLKHGDYVVHHLVSALNSTIYFSNSQKTYAFTIEKDTIGSYPADHISFVTASSAFIPANSPYIRGPHRINLFIDTDDRGDPALFILPMPAIANPEDFEEEYDADPILVSRRVSGLEIRFWDEENEDWIDEWEPENSIPQRIQVNVYVASQDETEEPMLFTRMIDFPVFDSIKLRLTGPSGANSNTRNTGTPRNTGIPRNTGNIGSPGPPR